MPCGRIPERLRMCDLLEQDMRDRKSPGKIQNRGELWLTTIRKYRHQRHGPTAAEGRMVRGPIVDPAAARAVDANFSGVRRSASSAWRKLTTLTIKTCACSATSWRSGARSSHGG